MSDELDTKWSLKRRERIGEQFSSPGRIGFYIQLALLVTPHFLVLYMFIVRRSGESGANEINLSSYALFGSLLVMVFTTYRFYRYTPLGEQIRDPARCSPEWDFYIPTRYLWCLIVVSLPFSLPASAADPARILIINAWDDTMPAAVRATTAIRNRLAESSLQNAEIYYDTLDLSRFPGTAHQERMARLLSEKYAETPPDIMIALGRVALEYLIRHRETFAPGVPIIVCYWSGATPAIADLAAGISARARSANQSRAPQHFECFEPWSPLQRGDDCKVGQRAVDAMRIG